MNRYPSLQAGADVFLRYLPSLESPGFRASTATWPNKIKQVLRALSPTNSYLHDELEAFIRDWPNKKWDIEKAAPEMDDPQVVINFFNTLDEKFLAVEEQLAAFEEARRKTEEDARRRAEEVESEKVEAARVAAELHAVGGGGGDRGEGGQDEVVVSFIAADFADTVGGDGVGMGDPSAGDVNKSNEEKEDEEDEEEPTDDDQMEEVEESGEGGEERPIARRAQRKRGRKKRKKKKHGVQPAEPLQILNAEETTDL